METKLNAVDGSKEVRLWSMQTNHIGVLGYIALLGLAERYAGKTAKEISKEIGLVSMDLIEPEFARLDRRNLIEKKKFLQKEYENIQKLKNLEVFEQAFVENGKSFADANNIGADMFLSMGVPRDTLKAASII